MMCPLLVFKNNGILERENSETSGSRQGLGQRSGVNPPQATDRTACRLPAFPPCRKQVFLVGDANHQCTDDARAEFRMLDDDRRGAEKIFQPLPSGIIHLDHMARALFHHDDARRVQRGLAALRIGADKPACAEQNTAEIPGDNHGAVDHAARFHDLDDRHSRRSARFAVVAVARGRPAPPPRFRRGSRSR